MSVYNAARYLDASIASILAQEGVSFEFIVVDDGSTDESSGIIARRARSDGRLRSIRQANQGLTRALVRGCLEARGQHIARQDADDVSLPGRLGAQADLLRNEPGISLVGCWTRYIGPLGEDLGTWEPSPAVEEATEALRCGTLQGLRGLGGHGTAMFRRSDYLRAGGYREQFYFAQDLDLWLRLTEAGKLGLVPKVLYEWRMSPGSITGRFRDQQVRTASLILDLARIRAQGHDESALMAQAALIRPGPEEPAPRKRDLAAGLYFIGKRLLDRQDRRAVAYLRRAAFAKPWGIRSWIALLAATRLGLRREHKPMSA